MTKNVAIIGASGYTGAELIRLISSHPEMKITALAANSKAGLSVTSVFPFLRHLDLPSLVTWPHIDYSQLDLVFCALPHKTSQEVVREIAPYVKTVDLSADFRLRDAAEYEKWYGESHTAPELLAKATYGLTEFYRDDIAQAQLVAGTGCNAATGLFTLLPLIRAGAIDPDDIILDMKCAVSGAGRSLKEHLLHAEMSEGTNPYSVGGLHRHLGEFDQELSRAAGRPVQIQFTPHLIPANRGILSTAYLKGDTQKVMQAYYDAYFDEPFVHVLPFGEMPSTHDVRGSNHVHIGVTDDRIDGRVIVCTVLDNLCKGSSGQAVQNANLMLGLEETQGLMQAPLFP